MDIQHHRTRPRETIPLASVDLDDRTFVITFAPDLDPLRDSIARAGMVHPPLVQAASPDRRYRVVSGFKRLLAARELGWSRLTVHLTSAADESDAELFLQSLDENLGTRRLNTVEISLAVDKLRHRFGRTEEELLSSHLPRLGLGSDPKILKMYLALAGLEDEIKRGLAADELSLAVAHRLTAGKPEDRLAFFRLVRQLKPGKNLQREFLSLLADIGRRENTAIDALLADQAIISLIANEDLPAPQRMKRIREILMRRRYPHFSEAMEQYERLRRRFRLPPGMALSAPPFFEGSDWRLSITFRSREELQQIRKAFQELTDHPLLDRLLKLPPQEEE